MNEILKSHPRETDLRFSRALIQTDRNIVAKQALEDFTSNFQSLFGIKFEDVYALLKLEDAEAFTRMTTGLEQWSYGQWYGAIDFTDGALTITPYVGDRFIKFSLTNIYGGEMKENEDWVVEIDYTARPTATHNFRNLHLAYELEWTIESPYEYFFQEGVEHPKTIWAKIKNMPYTHAREFAREHAQKMGMRFMDGLDWMNKSIQNESEPIVEIVFTPITSENDEEQETEDAYFGEKIRLQLKEAKLFDN